ncbi:MAG: glutathione S-transferase family protein [Alphaproteobacteria bacterium]|nr:glutathione S-transferase family protein [Alphaproteobacteria bacterium]MBU1515997.1 glutathione S-transferase family protein [Alphaproteobacteria bacterium]MBU2092788.1 glutathione S-transferase family protein [Alphaproteobacteria bacterium]MBU2153687.1 glutathione S-transferase family protein [Alphaproteobacteria bacterium]MBU2308315.1 glutathione S-transferase family protein [Alphaproteobacteria bacterium]
MDPILFYGVPEGCSFGAIVALEWSGRPYRLCRIQMPGEVSSPAYKRLNPLGETPTLMTADGATFSQTQAILQHIAATSGDPRMGARPGQPGFDRLNEMLAFLTTTFFSSFSPLWQTVEGASEADKAVLIPNGRRKVRKAHAQLEALLAGRDCMVGDGPTLAEAYFMGISRWNDFHQAIDPAEFPAVQALRARMEKDPAVRFALAIEHEEPAESAGGFRGHVGLEAVLEGQRAPA